jgi:hypothetical protein
MSSTANATAAQLASAVVYFLQQEVIVSPDIMPTPFFIEEQMHELSYEQDGDVVVITHLPSGMAYRV